MIDTDKYEGHTPANLWGREIVAEGKRKIFLNTAWLSSIGNDVYSNEKDRLLMADAPLLLEHVKSLTKTLELIGKNMPYDSWMHTLIKDVIGFEKWQAKEMIE